MQQPTKISEYLKTVCEQIRWKKSHQVLAEELENHIIDQKNAFIESGMDEETAIDRAIKEMGDPIIVGSELDRAHRPKTEWSIIILTAAVLLIGLAIRIFLTYDSSEMLSKLNSSIINIIVGIGCMIIMYFLDFTFIARHSKAIYLGIIAVIIFGTITASVVYGRNIYVQFVQLLIPTAFAGIIYGMRTKGYLGIILCELYFIPALIFGFNSRNLSSTLLVILACLVLITYSLLKGWFNVGKISGLMFVYVPVFIASITAVFMTFLTSQYRWSRLRTLLDPTLDPEGTGYLLTVTRNIMRGARFFGTGESGADYSMRLPEKDTDFLLTYLIHRFGWISFVLIITVISVFIVRIFILCQKQKSVLGRLTSISVLITFTLQVVLYAAPNLGFQLFTPLTLPLISYGGTSMAVNMILIGIILSVFKSGDLVLDSVTKRRAGKGRLFQFVDGKIIIDLNIR